MEIWLCDPYGTKNCFITNSEIIPRIGETVSTPEFYGKCTKVTYLHKENSCEVVVFVEKE